MVVLNNGAIPLAFAGNNERGVVVAKWDREYVVWNYYISSDSKGANLSDGQYFKAPADLQAANAAFQKRAKDFFGW